MNERIKELAIKSGFATGYDRHHHGKWIMSDSEMEKFAELIVKECAACCGSQADIKNIQKHFGLPVESNIQYSGEDASWSVETQYTREYNIPK